MTRAQILFAVLGILAARASKALDAAVFGMLDTEAGVLMLRVLSAIFPPLSALLWTAAASRGTAGLAGRPEPSPWRENER